MASVEDARLARYAEKIQAEVVGPEAFGDYVDRAARAVMAVADDEIRAAQAQSLMDAAGDVRSIPSGYPNNPRIRSLRAVANWLGDRADLIESGPTGDRAALRADWDRQIAWWRSEARRHRDALGSLRQRIEAMAYEAQADEQEPWVTPFELREALSDLAVEA